MKLSTSALLLLLGACVMGHEAGPGQVPEQGGLSDSALGYLRHVEEGVYDSWQPGQVATGRVQLEFKLDRDGKLESVRVLDTDSRDLADSCVRALQQAAPFGPVGQELEGLLARPIVGIFTFGDETSRLLP